MALNIQLPKLTKSSESPKAADPSKPPKTAKSKKIRKGKIPTKRHINVLIRKKQTFSLAKNWPIVALIALLLIVFCKFMVIDRLTAVAREANEISAMQTELTLANQRINSLQDLEDEYAHYTISGMTQEELSRVDRVEVMQLINQAFRKGAFAKNWNLTGNTMTLQVYGSSLRKLNELAADLEYEPIVQRCVISSADKRPDENGQVSATFIIYLQPYEE